MTMKTLLILACAVLAVALAAPSDDEHYTDKFDNVDLDDILSNSKLLENYMNCILEKGKCTAEGKELKTHMPDAIQTDCAKCTEVQKNGTKKVIKYLINNKPEYWNQLKAKFDPTGEHTKRHEDELREIKA